MKYCKCHYIIIITISAASKKTRYISPNMHPDVIDVGRESRRQQIYNYYY